MRAEVPHVPLADICDPKRPISYGILKVGSFVDGVVPVIRGGDIRNNRIEVDGEKKVGREISDLFKRTLLRGGEIVMNLIAEPGHAAVVPTGMAGANVSRDVAVIALADGVDPIYVNYFLQSPAAVRWLTARLQGSVTGKINLGVLRELPVPMPPIERQRRIAAILGAFDNKIELNRRLSATLDATARAMFRSWFVDEVPAGGTIRGLDEIAMFLNGLALQKFPPTTHGSLPVIKIAQLRSGDTRGADLASADLPADYVVRDGDVLFSWSGSLECVLWAGGKGALNQHLFKVTSADFPKWFYYLWIREHLADFREIAAGKATTMGHIQRHHLSQARVLVPERAVLGAADRVLGPMIEQITLRRVEARTLAEIRDSLLPKLLSGDIRMNHTDQIVETASA